MHSNFREVKDRRGKFKNSNIDILNEALSFSQQEFKFSSCRDRQWSASLLRRVAFRACLCESRVYYCQFGL